VGFMRNLGGPELLIILVVVLLIFGSSRLPGLARSIGASARELRRGKAADVDDEELVAEEAEAGEAIS